MKTFLIILLCILFAPLLLRLALGLFKFILGFLGSCFFLAGIASCFTGFSAQTVFTLVIGAILLGIAGSKLPDPPPYPTDSDIQRDLLLKEEKEREDAWWDEHWDYKDRYRDD